VNGPHSAGAKGKRGGPQRGARDPKGPTTARQRFTEQDFFKEVVKNPGTPRGNKPLRGTGDWGRGTFFTGRAVGTGGGGKGGGARAFF